MSYEKIRVALAAMPTEGPWFHHSSQHTSGGYISASEDRHDKALCHVFGGYRVPALTNGAFIAACNPAAVSALLSERDALVEALEKLRKDKARLDWLADVNNSIGLVKLPRDIVERNLGSLRDGIDDAMKL